VQEWLLGISVAVGREPSCIAPLTIEGGVEFLGVAFAFVPGQFGASESVYASGGHGEVRLKPDTGKSG